MGNHNITENKLMPNYDFERLGSEEFEHLIQSLLKLIIGSGTITFGDGPDGGREAVFNGKAPYPSISDQWGGKWIFQAKYHRVSMGVDKARQRLLSDLSSELKRITSEYNRACDNYILATNVPLSSTIDTGTHDKIDKIINGFKNTIPHIHVWGYDDLCRFIDNYPSIRESYTHFLIPGDLISKLIKQDKEKTGIYHFSNEKQIAEWFTDYVSKNKEQHDKALDWASILACMLVQGQAVRDGHLVSIEIYYDKDTGNKFVFPIAFTGYHTYALIYSKNKGITVFKIDNNKGWGISEVTNWEEIYRDDLRE